MSAIIVLTIIVVAFVIYIETRDIEYHSFYQRVDVQDKWDLETGLKKKFINSVPSGYILEDDELFLLLQSTDFIYIAHNDPWTVEKINNVLPEPIRKKYLLDLEPESWLLKENERISKEEKKPN